MPLLNDELSLWEIAHRWNNLDPNTIHLLRLPLELKDSFRLMINAILEADLDSSLLMEKWYSDSDTSPDMHIRYYINDIYTCIWGKKFNRRLFKIISITRYSFKTWCELYDIPLPEFWFPSGWKYQPDRYSLLDDENAETQDHENTSSKLRKNQETRIACRQIAEQLWKEDSTINITEMVKHGIIQKYGGGKNYGDDTVRRWISELAPPDIRGKKGRPPNNKK